MTAERSADLAPAMRATAFPLPLRDDSVDAAMAILTIHHWDDHLEPGVRELRRVARGPVVIVTYDPDVSAEMWLIATTSPRLQHSTVRRFRQSTTGPTGSVARSESNRSPTPEIRPTGRGLVLGAPRACARRVRTHRNIGICAHGTSGAEPRCRRGRRDLRDWLVGPAQWLAPQPRRIRRRHAAGRCRALTRLQVTTRRRARRHAAPASTGRRSRHGAQIRQTSAPAGRRQRS